jgi:hypothetical protein
MKELSYSPQVLDQTPDRVVPFLRAIATCIEIRIAMTSCGYNDEEQATGWRLLLNATGYTPQTVPVTDDAHARAAITQLDTWDEPGFRRIHAALGRLHIEQDEFVFNSLEPAKGAAAVVSVATLLDRLDALESAPERAATRTFDRAALDTLARRGIDPNERRRLRELVHIAQAAKPPVHVMPAPSAAEHEATLRELRAWYNDWAETARAVVRRRDHLLLMGLAQRRSQKDEQAAPAPAATV